jgi:hypothetical protein
VNEKKGAGIAADPSCRLHPDGSDVGRSLDPAPFPVFGGRVRPVPHAASGFAFRSPGRTHPPEGGYHPGRGGRHRLPPDRERPVSIDTFAGPALLTSRRDRLRGAPWMKGGAVPTRRSLGDGLRRLRPFAGAWFRLFAGCPSIRLRPARSTCHDRRVGGTVIAVARPVHNVDIVHNLADPPIERGGNKRRRRSLSYPKRRRST